MAKSGRITIKGLEEFVPALRKLGPAFRDELVEIHKQAADMMLDAASGPAGRASSGLEAVGNDKAARLVTGPGADAPDANVRFWGAKRHTGWYARRRYHDSGPQHPEWVGNGWAPGKDTDKPMRIGDPLNATSDDVYDLLSGEYIRLARKAAFPD